MTESHSRQECCEACERPCCQECAHHIFAEEPGMPPAALANDMIIYSAPTALYIENVTVMEILCASVCVTSMLCFTLEDKYSGHRAMAEFVHDNEHRMAARGNATSFPLLWQDLLKQLTEGAKIEELGRSASSPRTGEELAHVVSMFVKTSNAKDDADKHMARFIHQDMVRRSVVVKLIETMKRKGHRAYNNIDMNEVIAKSVALPEKHVPPEIIRLLPEDDLLSKIEVQKHKTPVPVAKSVE